jgi:hypothetical protein
MIIAWPPDLAPITEYRIGNGQSGGIRAFAQPANATVEEYGLRSYIRSISAGCAHLARRLSGPALKRMRECAHLMKAEQPRNFGYMQLLVSR